MFGRENHVFMEKNPDYGGDRDILKSTWDSIICVENDSNEVENKHHCN